MRGQFFLRNPVTFHYTGWLIGILILAFCNPNRTGWCNPPYNPTNLIIDLGTVAPPVQSGYLYIDSPENSVASLQTLEFSPKVSGTKNAGNEADKAILWVSFPVHQPYLGEYLHVRYLKCLVIVLGKCIRAW